MQRRVWRSWRRVSFPYSENGLGVRSLYDVLAAFSCKLWWKFRTLDGLWAKYVSSIQLQKSCMASRVASVDDLMNSHCRMLVRDGSCSFLKDNWSGQGKLVDLFGDLCLPLSDRPLRDFFKINNGCSWICQMNYFSLCHLILFSLPNSAMFLFGSWNHQAVFLCHLHITWLGLQ